MKTNWPLCSPNRRARARWGRRAQGGAALEVGAGAAMGGIAQPGAHTPGQDSGPSRHGASPNGSRGSWDTSNQNAQNADDAPPPVKAETDAQARWTQRCGRPGWAQPQHRLPPAPGGSQDPARPPVTAREDYPKVGGGPPLQLCARSCSGLTTPGCRSGQGTQWAPSGPASGGHPDRMNE